jgi:hypothetical protein
MATNTGMRKITMDMKKKIMDMMATTMAISMDMMAT